MKVCIIHSGILSQGHIELKSRQKKFDIISVRDCNEDVVSNYECVLIDESQRLYQIDFDCLIKAFKEKGIKCIFSYDFFQVLSYTEQNRNIPEQLKQQEEFVENKLSDKIRTNAEIVSFIKNVIDLKNKPKRYIDYSNIVEDEELFKKYLYYTSAKYIQRLKEPKNQDLMEIVNCPDEEKKVKQFNTYIRQEENLKKFQRIFPIIATTSISAHKIGEPGTYFDMVIMDEASQGNIAMSLVPIIRGRSLMLVGDPQQLSPVILLNPIDNEKLKRIYGVTDEYDYIKNSIYKTYLACDAVSEEILLSHHYRCNKKIISFNNKKYYNNKLIINSPDKEANPLIFKNIPANTTNYKNTAPQEVEEIISFIKEHPDKSIGIITPFTNQKELINKALKDNGMENIPCGTVHAFQGDEKDVVLFSLAITQQTYQGTYDWLKNNKELINVATSRAKDQLVILSDIKELKRLHSAGDDDIYELVDYVQTNGEAQVTARETSSRALGIKPYSTQTEAAFLTTLNHALDNVLNTNNRCVVQREVSIAHVFQENESYDDLFYTGRFDFVVYEKGYRGQDMPILAIELDGKEHKENAIVRARDEKKNAICRAHGFELIRVENSYARRYNYIKNILIQYFKSVR